MKQIVVIFLLFISNLIFAQSNFYTKKGVVIEGYDVTEYFNNKAVEGKKMYSTTYKGAKFQFVSEANKKKFEANPVKFVPQYGGYCAYALGLKDDLVSVNPETYEIRDGKLYLFYNSWGTNTFEKWLKENPEDLKNSADKNWKQIKNNQTN